MIPNIITTLPTQISEPPIKVIQEGLKCLYLTPEVLWNKTSVYDPTKQIKRWVDPYAEKNADDDFPDSISGKPTVGYLSYRISTKEINTVKPYTFRMTVAEAMRLNIPSPNDTQASFPSEVPFPCRELDPSTEIFGVDPMGGICVRNIEMWNHQVTTGDRSGFTAQDRAMLLMLLNKISAIEAKLASLK